MAKTVAVEWDAFFQGEIRPKDVAAVRALRVRYLTHT
ncbi:hypothetical protein J2S04_002329 [Alicyclobacillus tengchongensis]|uniref:Uncharacterized protein n=1 Tax=Alicyclobacillus tolerans TaxID=90970 RepID=A0ABT9LYK6_9BACL|nr:hypothetical protein [Alicyclobacillus tengchongensis]